MTRTVGRLALLGVVVSLLAGSMSYAALIPTSQIVRDPANAQPFTNPDQALGAPWIALKLGVTATAGEIVQAIEVSITGQLHQRWTDADGDEVFEATGNSAAASGLTNGDTHLLAPTGSLFGSGPNEDNPGTGSPLTSTATAMYGVGSSLQGAWAVLVPAQQTNIAYLVIRRGSAPTFDINVKIANPTGQVIGSFTTSDFIPEPTTFAMVGLGLIGMVGMVRRRS